MKIPDTNELIKDCLSPFVVTDWNILPSEDLDDQVNVANQERESIEITNTNVILWFAKGLHNSVFFLKDYSLDSKIQGIPTLPTEYLGALVVHMHKRCILSACWHGYDFLMMDKIKTCFEPYPISKIEIEFCYKITKALSSIK